MSEKGGTSGSSTNRVLYFIPNVGMSNGHQGLLKIAKDNKIDVMTLHPGEFVLFINRSFTALKMYAAGGVLLHYKTPDGRLLNVKALKLLPNFFNGKDIGYQPALRQVIHKEFEKYIDERMVKS